MEVGSQSSVLSLKFIESNELMNLFYNVLIFPVLAYEKQQGKCIAYSCM